MLALDAVEDVEETTVEHDEGSAASVGGAGPAKISLFDVLLAKALASVGVKHLAESSVMPADDTRRECATQTGGGFIRPIVGVKESELVLFTSLVNGGKAAFAVTASGSFSVPPFWLP